jgi:sialate O-acetylesterase
MRKSAVCAAVLLASGLGRAEVTLPAVFSSHMVLQRDGEIPVWGRAEPGEKVTVMLAKESREVVAGNDGSWKVALPPLPAGGPYEFVVSGDRTAQPLRMDDVLIGDVWFCSGQSNMGLMVKNADRAREEIASANFPQIRIFNTKRTIAESPQFSAPGNWEVCSPATVGDTSAVAYFFGRKLHRDLGVPIGLLHSSWGGTAAEVWMPRPVLESNANFKPILERWKEEAAAYPEAKRAYDEKLPELTREYERAVAEAKAAGTKAPNAPRPPRGEPGSRDTPTGGYYGMVQPHVPFAVKGVIWYQGEANARRGWQYRELFSALIRSWREAWGRSDLPFLYVQLPNMIRKIPPAAPDWAEVREAQLMALKELHTAMVATIDVGDPNDLHPKNKLPVGERLAQAAEGLVYGKQVAIMGPIYKSATAENGSMVIAFDHTDGGLEARGGTLKSFVIAGEDKQFAPAEAVIDGDSVWVSSPAVPKPVTVRYAWEDNPEATLYNKAGLPASPFRVDDWPESTYGKN